MPDVTFNCTAQAAFASTAPEKIGSNPVIYVGYITAFKGLHKTSPVTLAANLISPYPYPGKSTKFSALTVDTGASIGKVTCVGVMQRFYWPRIDSRDPLSFVFFINQKNKDDLAAMVAQHNSGKIDELGWWIGAYDTSTSQWFEAGFPKSNSTITGKIPVGTEVRVDPNATTIGNYENLFKVSFDIEPLGDKCYDLDWAVGATKDNVYPWGANTGVV